MTEDLRDQKLTDEAQAAAMTELPRWRKRKNKEGIRRAYQLRNFDDAMAFVNRIADVARAHNHHPEVIIRLSRVEVSCWTHECGGLTSHDVGLAKAIDEVLTPPAADG